MKKLSIAGAIAVLYFSSNLYAQTADSLRESSIEEVVLIGYGKARSKDLTGSVSTIKMEETLKQPVADLGQAIQGRAAGVQVVNSGEPGNNVTFRIRGTGTIQNNNPLIVVDGMPLNGGLNQINMNDVESVNILKDASSTAIYGSRGANGVVIITTKRGSSNVNLNFNSFVGVQMSSNLPQMLNASQYAALNNEMLINAGISPNAQFNDPDSLGEGTNWISELFRPALISNYSLSYGYRNNKTNLYVSGSYFKQEGVVEETDYDRYIVQFNSDTKVNSRLKFGNSLKLGQDTKKRGAYDIRNTFLALPTQQVTDEEGNYTGPTGSPLYAGDIENPIGKAKWVDMTTTGYNTQGSIYGEYELFDGLKFKSLGGAELNMWFDRTWAPKYSWGSKVQENSYLSEGSNRSITLLWDNTLTYEKIINDHNINAVLGTSAQKNNFNYLNGSIQKFASESTQQINNGILQPTINGNASDWALLSYFGRLNYILKGRYYFTGTMRRDGSSRFGTGNKWGWFPSMALAWRVSEEEFFQDQAQINDFKLRLGYGVTGNQEIGNYAFSSSYNTYLYNFNNAFVSAVLPTVLPNPDVKWEGQEMYNAGIDLVLADRRINLTVDGYIKNTNDMLVPMAVPVTSGYSDIYVPSINAGSIRNVGVETTIATKNLVEDVKWNTDFVFSFNRNKVISINSESPIITGNLGLNSIIGLIKTGYPVNVFYGYVTDGIFQTQTDVANHAMQVPGNSTTTSTAAGDIRFKDLNHDGIINDKDRTFIGDPNPDFSFSLNNTITYKDFDLSVFLQGVYGNEIFNANRMYTESMSVITNQGINTLHRWTAAGSTNEMPRAIYGDPNNNSRVSDRYVEDGSYIKLKNVSLGYNFPQNFTNDKVKDLRVYISGQNLLTFTNYSGIDPEVPVNGIDNAVYPITSIYSLGLNLTF